MQLSFKQYRTIDLIILLIVLAAAEAVTAVAAKYWFTGEIYVLSPTVAVLCIVMMRWGAFAAVHAAAAGAALCIVTGAAPEQFAVYCIGNCFALLGLLWFRFLGKDKVRAKVLITGLYTVTVFCAVQIGRWIVGLFFGCSLSDIGGLFAGDSLSLVFAIIVVQLTRRLDGVFEDQKTYLLRTESERRKKEAMDLGDTEYGDDAGHF